MLKLKKEPIKNVKLWIVLGVLFLLSVPWYLPVGSYKPIIFGLPYWGWIIILDSIAISATITYAFLFLWKVEGEDTNTKGDE
ncbi:hypothetical protein [Virgibacillus oceani]|uniref:DUF3311 domain-containing protein n=1 Tax=Virgibacillus oceani TaxID=1479511 RepID=A0A917M7L1_9BACI|nr:hypothetical protein [Virgibacillus oceani]GGG82830.1 hypothetical protein GCM10011398_30480 [Virgibacillus oceani]